MATTGTNNLDLSALSKEARISLRKLLYRQECRAWLLALGLPFLIVLVSSESGSGLARIAEVAYSIVAIFLAFWVIYPSQRVLSTLRKTGDSDEGKISERRFDDSWSSLWDFVPPLVLPLGIFLAFLFYRLVRAI